MGAWRNAPETSIPRKITSPPSISSRPSAPPTAPSDRGYALGSPWRTGALIRGCLLYTSDAADDM
eukprot:12393025-Alexandrium_andersonii.AAC.1